MTKEEVITIVDI